MEKLTKEQRYNVLKLIDQGLGYRKIAVRLNLSENRVRYFVQKNKGFCRNCGKPIATHKGSRERIFCSDLCRYKYNYYNTKDEKKGKREYTCPYCGKKFYAYAERKYCSHECYINARFKNECKEN